MRVVAKQFLIILLAIGMTLLPAVADAQQQSGAKPNVQPVGGGGGVGGYRPPNVPQSLSLAVVQTMQAKMVTLNNKLQNNTVTPSDYAAASTSVQAYFANSDETGWTANLQTWIIANESLFTTDPTTAQLQAGYAALQQVGVVSTYGQYVQTITGVSLADRQAFWTQVKTSGLAAYHAGLISELNTLSAQLSRRGGGMVLLAGCEFNLHVAGLYLGIVALAVAGPVGVGIAVAGLALGGASLLC
jgi:hypothetical protein